MAKRVKKTKMPDKYMVGYPSYSECWDSKGNLVVLNSMAAAEKHVAYCLSKMPSRVFGIYKLVATATTSVLPPIIVPENE